MATFTGTTEGTSSSSGDELKYRHSLTLLGNMRAILLRVLPQFDELPGFTDAQQAITLLLIAGVGFWIWSSTR